MSLLKVFNNHLLEFLNDVKGVVQNKTDIKSAIFFVNTTKSLNAKMFIQGWYIYIYQKYLQEINKGDFTFFLNKDYSNDVTSSEPDDSNKVLGIINTIRREMTNLNTEEQKKVMKYAQNLSKICGMYFSQ
tara:strand:+ start:945 stop:1334 length:390 start_codon:yes stop_codon:yes gene_type:complete